MYHNEVKQYLIHNVKRLPQSKRYKKKRHLAFNNYLKQYASSEIKQIDDQDQVLSFSVADFRAITSIIHYDDDNCDLSEEDISSEMIKLCINTLRSDHITPEEQALGFYTRKKLKRLSNWNEWKAGETKQIEQFQNQRMFGDPIDPSVIPLPDSSVILRPHWQYSVKRSVVRRS